MSTGERPYSFACVNPVTDPAWHALLGQPAAGLFHSPPWLQAVTDAYGFNIEACIATGSDQKPAGGVTFCEIDDAGGHRLISAPFSDTTDPLISSLDVWHGLFDQLQARQLPVSLRCMTEQRVAADDRLTVVKRARWHRLAVQSSEEESWRRISPESRRAIRMAERANVTVRPIAGDGDREAFHGLHAALRKQKYRLLAQPIDFFAAIERRFAAIDGWHSLGAFLDGRMIAATIYLRWGDTLYYKFNASSLDTLGVRPNNLLVWSGIATARALGCGYLDLGPSDDDQPGLIRFKRNFGAVESELRFLRWIPPGWSERPTGRSILGEVTRLMTEPGVPDGITARAGAAFYRYFA